MKYSSARKLIQDGDVVFFRDGKLIGQRLIRYASGDPRHHVAMCFWLYDRLMVVESTFGGRRVVTLSAYEDHNMDIIKAPRDWDIIKDEALSRTGIENYGYRDLYRIIIRERWGIDFGDPKGEVCSEFIAKLLKAKTSVPSPGLLFKELLDNGIRCRVHV